MSISFTKKSCNRKGGTARWPLIVLGEVTKLGIKLPIPLTFILMQNYLYIHNFYQGINMPRQVETLCKEFVRNLFKDSPEKPSILDSSLYPSRKVIRNHIYVATCRAKLSKIDQVNLEILVKRWQEEDPGKCFYFRKYSMNSEDIENVGSDTDSEDDPRGPPPKRSCPLTSNLLYVHQESWQRDLLVRYGSSLCLMDATYKTTKYSLPLFFLCVLTNAGYMAVGK